MSINRLQTFATAAVHTAVPLPSGTSAEDVQTKRMSDRQTDRLTIKLSRWVQATDAGR